MSSIIYKKSKGTVDLFNEEYNKLIFSQIQFRTIIHSKWRKFARDTYF